MREREVEDVVEPDGGEVRSDESWRVDPNGVSDVDRGVHRVDETWEEDSDENDDSRDCTPVESSRVSIDSLRVVELGHVVRALFDEEVVAGEEGREGTENDRVASAERQEGRRRSENLCSDSTMSARVRATTNETTQSMTHLPRHGSEST